ncbi:hypothetical protein ACHAXT_008613 [Thalassiosira profunda]
MPTAHYVSRAFLERQGVKLSYSAGRGPLRKLGASRNDRSSQKRNAETALGSSSATKCALSPGSYNLTKKRKTSPEDRRPEIEERICETLTLETKKFAAQPSKGYGDFLNVSNSIAIRGEEDTPVSQESSKGQAFVTTNEHHLQFLQQLNGLINGQQQTHSRAREELDRAFKDTPALGRDREKALLSTTPEPGVPALGTQERVNARVTGARYQWLIDDIVARVKRTFADRPVVYREFLSILQVCQAKETRTSAVLVRRIVELLLGHDGLIVGFLFLVQRGPEHPLRMTDCCREMLRAHHRQSSEGFEVATKLSQALVTAILGIVHVGAEKCTFGAILQWLHAAKPEMRSSIPSTEALRSLMCACYWATGNVFDRPPDLSL